MKESLNKREALSGQYWCAVSLHSSITDPSNDRRRELAETSLG